MIRKWLNIIRAHTLFASACPVLVGGMVYLFTTDSFSATEYSPLPLQLLVLLLTTLCAVSLQILANLINDYYDFKQGADQQGRAGYERPLAEGTMRPQTILRAIFLTAAISILIGTFLVAIGKLPILLIGLSALFFAWLYTATRYSLAYLGLGDLFVLIYYGLLASWGTGYLLAATETFTWENTLNWELWQQSPLSIIHYPLSIRLLAAGAVNGLISMLVLAANNLRDIEDDRPVGKRTIPVRFGKRAGELLVLLEVLLMPLLSYFAFGWSLPMILLFPALYWFHGILHATGSTYNRYLALAGKLNVLYTLLVFLQLLLF